MKITATQEELLAIVDRHSGAAEGMAGTLPPDEMEEARTRIRLEHRLLCKAIRQVKYVSMDYEGNDPDPDPEPQVHVTKRDRVWGWFKDHPDQDVRPRDLKRVFDDYSNGVDIALRKLVIDGIISQKKRGVYVLNTVKNVTDKEQR